MNNGMYINTVIERADCAGANYDCAAFVQTEIRASNWRNCVFCGTSFANVAMHGTLFDSCKFDCSTIAGADPISHVAFDHCEIENTLVRRVNMKDCIITSAWLETVVIGASKFYNTKWIDVSLDNVDVHDALFENDDWIRVSSEAARFTDSRYAGTRFVGCDLFSGDFDACVFSGASFVGSLLKEMCFHKCTLENCTFKRVDFDDVPVSHCTFTDCIFEDCTGMSNGEGNTAVRCEGAERCIGGLTCTSQTNS